MLDVLPGRCLDAAICRYFNRRGMLQTSFTLQTYPRSAGESVSGTTTTGIAVCDPDDPDACEEFDALLVYPSPVDATGRNRDRYYVMRSGEWSVADNRELSYTQELVKLDGTVETTSVERPWVGFRPVIEVGRMVLEYTDSLGAVSLHNPELFHDCRPACPYLESGGDLVNSLLLEFEGDGPTETHRLLLPGGRAAPMAEGCRYYGNGLVECGDFSEFARSSEMPSGAELPPGRYRFAYELPYPYCPALLSSGMATMEEYVLPRWTPTEPYLFPDRGFVP